MFIFKYSDDINNWISLVEGSGFEHLLYIFKHFNSHSVPLNVYLIQVGLIVDYLLIYNYIA